MKMYKAPTVETVELNLVDVIAASGGEKGIDTTSYDFATTKTTVGGTTITHTNKGEEWQNSWN